MIDSRQKGKRFEREIAKRINAALGCNCRRTPCSGALDIKGDVMSLTGEAANWTFECKNQESMNVWKCIAQSKAEAAGSLKDWCLVFTRNHEGAYACIDFDTFLGLLQDREKAHVTTEDT